MINKYDRALWLDFETYSECPITKAGRRKYVCHPSTNIVCKGYAFDDQPVYIWTPAKLEIDDIMSHVSSGYSVYAFNAAFDWGIWNAVGVEHFGWPELSLDQMVDVQALCRTYTLPGSLAGAGEVMKLKMPKDATGKALIKLCCTPNKQGRQPNPQRLPDAFKSLFEYCKRDVEAMRELTYKLPRQQLIPFEHEVWKLTCEMNENGLPIDEEAVDAILSYLEVYIKQAVKQIPKLSGGAFTNVTQVAKLGEWCKNQGYEIPNMQAPTVEEAIEDPQCPKPVKHMLQLRLELGRTSTAKYTKIKDMIMNGRVHDNMAFHMAATGRWGGRGFQLQNLPRAKKKSPERWIRYFKENIKMKDPVGAAKAIIRPMIKAPEGWKLIVSDYSGIENRILAWLAGDQRVLNLFKDPKYDQYIDMAMYRFGVTRDQVTKFMRQVGKQIILGAGYGMAAIKYQETCAKSGMFITLKEAEADINAYRALYYLVKKLWKELKLAATRAVMSGKRQSYGHITFGTSTVNGTKWLGMLLPSGKAIYYCEPTVEDHYVPGYETMGKVPTIRHWGINPYTKKWSRKSLIPGRITENADQGTARECMAYGAYNVKTYMPEVQLIGLVHDEAIGLIREDDINDHTQKKFNDLLCDIPWIEGCPLRAEGYIADRYKKE